MIELLAGKGIPTVVQTVWPPPPTLAHLNEKTTVLIKPVDATLLLNALLVEIDRKDD